MFFVITFKTVFIKNVFTLALEEGPSFNISLEVKHASFRKCGFTTVETDQYSDIFLSKKCAA